MSGYYSVGRKRRATKRRGEAVPPLPPESRQLYLSALKTGYIVTSYPDRELANAWWLRCVREGRPYINVEVRTQRRAALSYNLDYAPGELSEDACRVLITAFESGRFGLCTAGSGVGLCITTPEKAELLAGMLVWLTEHRLLVDPRRQARIRKTREAKRHGALL